MIKSLLTTIVLTYSQVNFSNTPIHNEPQKAVSTSVVQEGIVDYEVTLTPTNATNQNTGTTQTYKRTLNENFTYLNIQGEILYSNYYKQDGETYENQPSLWYMSTRPTQYPYVKVKNLTQTTQTNYKYTQELTMLQINPYYTNVSTDITDNYKFAISVNTALVLDALAIPQNYQQYTITKTEYQVDIFTSTYNWSGYMGTSTWYTDGYVNNIYNELSNQQNGYNYNHIERTIERTANTQEFTIEFNVIPENINYLFMFVTPVITLNTNLPYYSIAHINGGSQATNGTQTLKIAGTGIIPTTTQEIVDIPGMMFDIVSMPWYFISTAFNLTLFPGTQYQVNISNLFLAVIAVFVFIFILKLVTGKT